jgi:N-acetylneuraminic acid mutarotase
MKKTKALVTTSVLTLVFVMISFCHAESATLFCNSCADCTSKVQSASAGDIIMLSADISAVSETHCIDFNNKSAVILDCDSHAITDPADAFSGIFSGYSGGNSNTIRNCTVIGFDKGVYLVYGQSNTVENSSFLQNQWGIDLNSSDANTIQGVIARLNSIGITVRYDSDNNVVKDSYIVENYMAEISFSPHPTVGDPEFNLIYNNYFSNSGDGNIQVVRVPTDTDRILENPNEFSQAIDCASQSNIIGGNCVGGNYWSSPSGNGFSDTCADGDGDGICDSPFDFSANGATMIDDLPLTEVSGVGCANPDKDGDSYNTVGCGGTDCDDNPMDCGADCYPGAIEICDGYDNDCNGRIDDGIACGDMLLTKSARFPTIIGNHSCVEESSTNNIYCFGGIYRVETDKPQTDRIVKYDPAADTATVLPTTLPTIRDHAPCVEDSSTHKIYCFGGYYQEFVCTDWQEWGCVGGSQYPYYLDDILEYDTASEALTIKSTRLPADIANLACVEDTATHKIYCFGGTESDSSTRDRILEYTPAADTLVTKSATLPSGRVNLACAEDAATQMIYCFGGNSSEIIEYDPATDTVMTKSATFPVSVQKLSCVADASTQKIYCFGGETTNSQVYNTPYLDKIFEYDPVTDALSLKQAQFPLGRHSLSCAPNSASHKIYCFGGSRNVLYFDEITEYTAKSWLKGDLNRDCAVDESDLAIFAPHLGRADCGQGPACEGDAEPDGDVDGADFAPIINNLGKFDCP